MFLGDLISPLFNAFEYLPQNIFTTCQFILSLICTFFGKTTVTIETVCKIA